jgi:hypothetical protein
MNIMTLKTNENITGWDTPDSMVQTVAGTITYRKWCEMEIERFAKKGKATRLLTFKTLSGSEQICIGRA